MTPKVEWSQIATDKHPAGMRLECPCGYVEHFGDSPAGDLQMAEAKKTHQCPEGMPDSRV